MTIPGDPECAHARIAVWRDEDGSVAVWACADCSRRFYPACPICVDSGHRGQHLPKVRPNAAKERHLYDSMIERGE